MSDTANLSVDQVGATTCSRQRLSEIVRARLVDFLELDSHEDIGPEDAFADLGTDSRQAVEFKILLEELFQCRLRTTVLFEYPTVDRLVELLFQKISVGEATLVDNRAEPIADNSARLQPTPSTAHTYDAQATFPLSETQKGLWYISQTLDCETSFNVPLLFRLAQPLDQSRFDRALRTVAQRHPVMRVRFRVQEDTGQVYQQTMPVDSIPSIERLSPGHGQSLHEIFWQKLRTPIELSNAPPLRAYCGQDSEGQHYCLIVFHHIILDGLSAVPLSAELWKTYEANEFSSHQTPSTVDRKFWEYLDWEANYLASAPAEADAAYWQANLARANQHLELLVTGNAAEDHVDCVVQHLPVTTTTALDRLSRRLHAPRSIVLLSAFYMLLYRLSGNNVITVTTPVSGRPGGNQGPWKDAFGCFINLMVTSASLESNQAFASLVEQVRQEFLEGLEHSQLPLAQQFQSTNTSLLRDRNNPFPISFTYQNIFSAWNSNHTTPSIAEFDFSVYQEIQDDLTLEVYDFGDQLRLNWKFQRKCFDPNAIECWAEIFENLLQQVFEEHTKAIGSFRLVSDLSVDKLRAANDKRASQFNDYATVIQWIDATSRMYADNTAIVCGTESFTYRWLIDESHRIATEIQSLPGYLPGTIIPVAAERTPQTLARILGVMRSQCAYMPVDSTGPSERLRCMLEDVSGQCLPGTAYVLFTSGTTGRPKAVPIGHAALVNLCQVMINAYGLNPQDRVLQFAQLTFDMSVEEIFPALCVGACIVMREDEDLQADRFESLVSRNAVSVLNLPPSYHQALHVLGQQRRQQLFASVRIVSFGGDKLPVTTLREVQATGVRVFNAYGPTEACVNCSLSELTHATSVHIGGAIDGAALLVVDDQRRLVPAYCSGELCILGCGLSSGYLGAHGSNTKFVNMHDPFIGDETQAYLTGDQAYYDAQGNIHLLGRTDDQISLRGHRIEPAEVEAAIESHPLVQAAAVALTNDRLAAWYTSPQAISSVELREYLAERLPRIMIPTFFFHSDALPLNDRGKLDRSKLTALFGSEAEPNHKTFAAPPFTTGQQQVFKTVQAILGDTFQLAAVQPDATFWDVGGHSLLAIQVVTLLKQELGIEVTLKEFMQAGTFYDLAVLLAARLDLPARSSACTASQSAITRTNQLSAGQKRLWFLDQLGQNRAYKIPALAEVYGQLNAQRLMQAIERIVARHEILRTNFIRTQEGPVCIVHPSRAIPLSTRHFASSAAARRWIDEQIELPFSLTTDPLMRVSLATFENDRSWLLICLHHIITDGWSMRLLVGELQHYYSSTDSELPALSLQYQDCTDQLSQSPLTEARAYWEKQLQGLDEAELITDLARPAILSDRGDTIGHTIAAELNSQVAQYCRRLQITPAAFWLGCLAIVLRKRRSGDDICIGLPVAGRPHASMSNVIGFFVNTVVIRLQQTEHLHTASEGFFRAVANTLVEALEHQTLPIESIIEQVMPERRTDRSPIFQVLFSYAPDTLDQIQLGDCKLKAAYPKSDTAKFELTFSINDLGDGSAALFVEYATDCFTATTARQLAEQLQRIAEQAVDSPTIGLSQLHLATSMHDCSKAADQHAWQSGLVDFSEAFQEQVLSNPGKMAIEAPDGSVSYQDLQQLVCDQVSRFGSGTQPVVLHPRRSSQLIVQCIAALQVARPITFADSCAGQVGDLSGCAWLLPTSGTTGAAKSVAVSARGMHVHNQAFANLIRLSSEDRVAQYATPEFDLFIEEVFPTLRSGATVVIVPDEYRLDPVALARWTSAAGITVLDLPTAVFHALAANVDALSQLSNQVRTIVVGGEKLAVDRALALATRYPTIEIWNTYGPTEATIICCAHRFDAVRDIDDVPLGQPLGDAELIVVDPDGLPVPDGAAGELVIAGSGVALGYVTDGQLVLSSGFRPHPLNSRTLAYWTGDLVRFRSDGQLVFLGRTDDEVKIRGQRVRLIDVQRMIQADSRVQAVAVVASNRHGTGELIAAVVADAEVSQLRREIGAAMPSAARPTTWLKVAQIPVSKRGKVDRRRILRDACEDATDSPAFEDITDSITLSVLSVWQELLKTEQLGIEDDFFLFGGHSLLAVELIERINDKFSTELSVLDAFRYSTVSALSQRLKEILPLVSSPGSQGKSLVEYFPSSSNTKQAVIIMPGLPGIGQFYYPLAKFLSKYSPVVVLSMPGTFAGEPAKSLRQCAQVWSDELRSLLAEHFIEGCTYVAHSYSASILIELVRHYGPTLPKTDRLVIVDAWPHQQQTESTRPAEWTQWLDGPHLQFAKPVVESALAASSLTAGKLPDLDVYLVIAEASQWQLSHRDWKPWFDNVHTQTVPGNHLSIVQSPQFHSWISLLNTQHAHESLFHERP